MLLLSHFVRSSDINSRGLLQHPEFVADLYSRVAKIHSHLQQDFGVEWSSLAFLYETNCNYLYHYYNIGTAIKLEYILRDENLQIQKSFIDYPLHKGEVGFLVQNEYKNHEFKIRYASLVEDLTPKLNYVEGGENAYSERFLLELLHLRKQVDSNADLFNLTVCINFDIFIQLDVRGPDKELPKEYLDSDGVITGREIQKEIEEFFSSHSPVSYLFSSLYDFSIFKVNFDGFEISNLYKHEVISIYSCELDKSLFEARWEDFVSTFVEYREYLISSDFNSSYLNNFCSIYERFYSHIVNHTELNFDDLEFSHEHTSKEQQIFLAAYFDRIKLQLSALSSAGNRSEVLSAMDLLFPQRIPRAFLKYDPVFKFHSLQGFGSYLTRR